MDQADPVPIPSELTDGKQISKYVGGLICGMGKPKQNEGLGRECAWAECVQEGLSNEVAGQRPRAVGGGPQGCVWGEQSRPAEALKLQMLEVSGVAARPGAASSNHWEVWSTGVT